MIYRLLESSPIAVGMVVLVSWFLAHLRQRDESDRKERDRAIEALEKISETLGRYSSVMDRVDRRLDDQPRREG